PVGYMSHRHFTWRAPFSSQERPGLAWRSGEHGEVPRRGLSPRPNAHSISNGFRSDGLWRSTEFLRALRVLLRDTRGFIVFFSVEFAPSRAPSNAELERARHD